MTVVTGVLLVGGASRRFGSPKALARLGGKTLSELAWERLAWCDERLAVGKVADQLPLPFPLLDDGSDVRAPIVGLVAGLRAASCDTVVALPVDLPLITDEALRTLVFHCAADAAVPQTGPLPGAYRRSVVPVLERSIRAGKLGLRAALTELAVRVVALDPILLTNVNGIEDLPLSPGKP